MIGSAAQGVPSEEEADMKAVDVQDYARRLLEAHGDKAVAPNCHSMRDQLERRLHRWTPDTEYNKPGRDLG